MAVEWNSQAWNLLAPLTILASVIEGEASDATGQHAVASTMWNRLKAGGFGSQWSTVVMPLQFNGWKQPGPFASSLASKMLEEKFVPNTNALYYVSAWYAKEYGWHGTLIGGNVFFASNPFSGTGAPASYDD